MMIADAEEIAGTIALLIAALVFNPSMHFAKHSVHKLQMQIAGFTDYLVIICETLAVQNPSIIPRVDACYRLHQAERLQPVFQRRGRSQGGVYASVWF